jgi:hypothetical protein
MSGVEAAEEADRTLTAAAYADLGALGFNDLVSSLALT